MGYTKQAIKGFGWNSFLRVATMGLTVVKISILARLLSPDDFGLFSLVMIALGITEAVTETGINVTMVQSKQSVKYFLNTAWVIAILRGFLIGSLMVVLGLFMTKYYHQPQLAILVALAALIPIIKGFINPAIISMSKELRFFRESLYYLLLVVTEVIFAIVLGLILKSVLALILALVASAIFEVLISFIFFKDKPQFEYLPSRGKTILENAKGLTLSAALNYLHENSDDFILGKVIGIHGLGLYHNAYALAHKVNYEPTKAITHSTFPVYTKIADDHQRLKRGFLRSLAVTCGLISLTSLPLLVAPHLVVSLLLGEQWLEIVPVLKWLVFAGVLQSISIVIYNLFLAKSAYKLMNFHLFLSITLMVSLMLVLPGKYGLLGGSLAIFLSRLLSMPLLIAGTVKILRS